MKIRSRSQQFQQKSEGQGTHLPPDLLLLSRKGKSFRSLGKPLFGMVYLPISFLLKLIKNLVLIPVLFLLLVIMGALSSILVRNELRLSKLLTVPGRLLGLPKLCKAIFLTTAAGVMHLLRTTLGAEEQREDLGTPTPTKSSELPTLGSKVLPLGGRRYGVWEGGRLIIHDPEADDLGFAKGFLNTICLTAIFLCFVVSLSWITGFNKSSDISFTYLMTWLPIFISLAFLYFMKEANA